jgi:hypothetical protein
MSHGSSPWWWRHQVSLKRQPTIILHGSTSQKTNMNFILATVRTWNLIRVLIARPRRFNRSFHQLTLSVLERTVLLRISHFRHARATCDSKLSWPTSFFVVHFYTCWITRVCKPGFQITCWSTLHFYGRSTRRRYSFFHLYCPDRSETELLTLLIDSSCGWDDTMSLNCGQQRA